MAKSSPEKLAKALRANLKKRKAGQDEGAPGTPENPAKPAESGSGSAHSTPARRSPG